MWVEIQSAVVYREYIDFLKKGQLLLRSWIGCQSTETTIYHANNCSKI